MHIQFENQIHIYWGGWVKPYKAAIQSFISVVQILCLHFAFVLLHIVSTLEDSQYYCWNPKYNSNCLDLQSISELISMFQSVKVDHLSISLISLFYRLWHTHPSLEIWYEN